MKYLEPKALAVLTMDAKTTVEVTEAIFGDSDKEVLRKKKKEVFEALLALEDDGVVESRLCHVGMYPAARYWALKGGTFPEDGIEERPFRHRKGLRHERGSK